MTPLSVRLQTLAAEAAWTARATRNARGGSRTLLGHTIACQNQDDAATLYEAARNEARRERRDAQLEAAMNKALLSAYNDGFDAARGFAP